jgi:hypothetical protein
MPAILSLLPGTARTGAWPPHSARAALIKAVGLRTLWTAVPSVAGTRADLATVITAANPPLPVKQLAPRRQPAWTLITREPTTGSDPGHILLGRIVGAVEYCPRHGQFPLR